MSGTGGSSRDATTNDITAMMPSAVPWMVEDTRIGMAGVLGTCCTFPVNRSNMVTSALRCCRATDVPERKPRVTRGITKCFEETGVAEGRRDRKNHAAPRSLQRWLKSQNPIPKSQVPDTGHSSSCFLGVGVGFWDLGFALGYGLHPPFLRGGASWLPIQTTPLRMFN